MNGHLVKGEAKCKQKCVLVSMQMKTVQKDGSSRWISKMDLQYGNKDGSTKMDKQRWISKMDKQDGSTKMGQQRWLSKMGKQDGSARWQRRWIAIVPTNIHTGSAMRVATWQDGGD